MPFRVAFHTRAVDQVAIGVCFVDVLEAVKKRPRFDDIGHVDPDNLLREQAIAISDADPDRIAVFCFVVENGSGLERVADDREGGVVA